MSGEGPRAEDLDSAAPAVAAVPGTGDESRIAVDTVAVHAVADGVVDDGPVDVAPVADVRSDAESTGDPRVDAALARLAELDETPTHEHVAIVEDVQRRLHDALADAGTAG